MKVPLMFFAACALALLPLAPGRSWAAEAPGTAPKSSAGSGAGIRYSWAMVASTGAHRQLSAITKDTELKSGDEIKMMVRLETNCHVYVLHQDSEGGFALLFPYSLAQIQTGELRTETNYFIPQGPSWFRLDEKAGWERIYVLASEQRLGALEQLCESYRRAVGEARSRLAEQLTREVRELRRNSRIGESPAERPARVGGTVRGKEGEPDGSPDVARFASAFSGSKLLTRAITIDHK